MTENSVKKHTLYVMGGVAALLLVWASFGGRGDTARLYDTPLPQPEAVPTAEASATPVEQPTVARVDSVTAPAAVAPQRTAEAGHARVSDVEQSDIAMLLAPYHKVKAFNRYEAHFDSMPAGGVKMKINYLGGTLGRVFNDSNYLHISTAREIGIAPLSGIRSAWDAGARLERLQSCRDYYLDDLTHSLPYLVPKAHRLLADIGAAFRDSLQARGGGNYRIKVTSVLRTPRLVQRLRRRNRNAVDTSAHLFGTTFDISYSKFICDSAALPRTQEDLKNLLGEVVFAMRENGRCYVKYERKQACFHITAR
ncbi:MAG: hypothetical protein K2L78_01310 [Muribaculaceae bacterium]|nr:hypothetical protein [Muribaculaceae bacterium]